MVLEFLFGIALLAVVIFVLLRILGNVALGVLLVLIVFLASYLIVGSFPDLRNVPLIGQYIPKTSKAIAVLKDVLYSIDILGVDRTSDSNLLVTVANTGRLEVSDFTAYVNNDNVEILNKKDILKSGELVVFELDWKDEFERILIKTAQTESVYEFK